MFIRNSILISIFVVFGLIGCAETNIKATTDQIVIDPNAFSLVSNAGADATILSGGEYQLTASSNISSEDIASYSWLLSEIVSGDSTAQVSIDSPTLASSSFSLINSINETTIFKIRLEIIALNGKKDIDFINITMLADAPVDLTVVAGGDIDGFSSNVVSLAGSILSSGITVAKIRWLQISGEKIVTLINSDTLTPTFFAPWLDPTNNTLLFRLVVTDTNGNTAFDEVEVTIVNTAPLADPGPALVVLSGTSVTLDGSGSKNQSGGVPTSFFWSNIAAGINSITLTSVNSAIASFTAPTVTERTDYTFSLEVTHNSISDTQLVTISVVNKLTYNDFGGRYYGVQFDAVNNIAYMAKGEGGLGIFDVSVPSDIRFLATYNTEGNAQDVLFANGYAYIADQFNGLTVVDVASPASPVLAATLDFNVPGSRATALARSGDYLYVASYYGGLVTIDIKNPKQPKVVSSVDTVGKAVGIEISANGQFSYLADDSKGFIVFDLSNAASPVIKFTIDTVGDSYDVAINGNYLYVADGSEGLLVYNITNPNIAPVLITTVQTNGEAKKVTVDGSILMLADAKKGIKLFDISMPQAPTLVSSYDTDGETEDLAAIGNNIIVADGYAGMKIVNFSDLLSPIEKSTYTTIGTGKGIVVKNNYAYVVDFFNGLIVLDVSNPFFPELASHLTYDNKSRGIAVRGDYAYIANDSKGLRIINIADPLNPQLVSTQSIALNSARNVVISNDGAYAYLAGFYGGIYVLDISDKNNPINIGSNDFGGSQSKFVAQSNDVVYVANGDHSFAISDIVIPSAPSNTAVLLPGSFAASKTGDGHEIAVKGDYAYLAHNAAGLAVIKVDLPTQPTIVGEYTGGLNSINSVFINDNTLFATNSNVDSPLKDKNDFLISWDISIQGALISTPNSIFNIGGQFPAMDVFGNYLIMVGEGVKVIDVSDPLNPQR